MSKIISDEMFEKLRLQSELENGVRVYVSGLDMSDFEPSKNNFCELMRETDKLEREDSKQNSVAIFLAKIAPFVGTGKWYDMPRRVLTRLTGRNRSFVLVEHNGSTMYTTVRCFTLGVRTYTYFYVTKNGVVQNEKMLPVLFSTQTRISDEIMSQMVASTKIRFQSRAQVLQEVAKAFVRDIVDHTVNTSRSGMSSTPQQPSVGILKDLDNLGASMFCNEKISRGDDIAFTLPVFFVHEDFDVECGKNGNGEDIIFFDKTCATKLRNFAEVGQQYVERRLSVVTEQGSQYMTDKGCPLPALNKTPDVYPVLVERILSI